MVVDANPARHSNAAEAIGSIQAKADTGTDTGADARARGSVFKLV